MLETGPACVKGKCVGNHVFIFIKKTHKLSGYKKMLRQLATFCSNAWCCGPDIQEFCTRSFYVSSLATGRTVVTSCNLKEEGQYHDHLIIYFLIFVIFISFLFNVYYLFLSFEFGCFVCNKCNLLYNRFFWYWCYYPNAGFTGSASSAILQVLPFQFFVSSVNFTCLALLAELAELANSQESQT